MVIIAKFLKNLKIGRLFSQFVVNRIIVQFKSHVNPLHREGTIEIEVSRLAIGFQKDCIVQTPAVQPHHPQF